jgi:hypothetical protein
MKAIALAQAYVTLDRLVFYQFRQSQDLSKCYDYARRRLKEQEGWTDLQELCGAGAEEEEILWLLLGCEGLPGFKAARKVFGRPSKQLKKGLSAIEQSAQFIKKTRRHPFGILFQTANPLAADLPEHLRSWAAFVWAAQRDFGHRSHWFLNIAKARLVIHVKRWAQNHDPHDREVSGLIAAMTCTDYNADAQRRWRQKHPGLIQNVWLDPYTTKTREEREDSIRVLSDVSAQHPEIARSISHCLSGFVRLIESRVRNSRNRKSAKNRQ